MEILTQNSMAINEIRSIANTRHEDEDKNSVKSGTSPVQTETGTSSSDNIYQENQENGALTGIQNPVMEARTDRVETTFRSELNGDKNGETEKIHSEHEMEKIPKEEQNDYERNLETPKNMSTLTDALIVENAKKAYESQKVVNSWQYNTLFH